MYAEAFKENAITVSHCWRPQHQHIPQQHNSLFLPQLQS
jgi:hypothetical protein